MILHGPEQPNKKQKMAVMLNVHIDAPCSDNDCRKQGSLKAQCFPDAPKFNPK